MTALWYYFGLFISFMWSDVSLTKLFFSAGFGDQIFTVAWMLLYISIFLFLHPPLIPFPWLFSGSGFLCSPDSAGEASGASSCAPRGGRGGREGGRGRGQHTLLLSLSASLTCTARWGEIQPCDQQPPGAHHLLSAWWGKEGVFIFNHIHVNIYVWDGNTLLHKI